jgi:uncharacterized membrane protein
MGVRGQGIWLLIWVAIGTLLRFTYLDSKSLWSDEISTLVFSLGNSVRDLPLDQPIDLAGLLLPLRPRAIAGVGDVLHYLLTQSNHPPTYFVLDHLWLRLFPTQDGLVSVWAARALPALLGVAAIPALYGLGWLAFGSQSVGQGAAALMAVSPFGVYLSQEARHYSLAILLIIASLACLVVAARSIRDRTPLPPRLCLGWIVVNGLGISVHYFFTLTLAAEALVLLGVGLADWRQRKSIYPYWRRLGLVLLGTTIAGLVWLPFWQGAADSGLTRWIYKSDPVNRGLWTLVRSLIWLVSMVVLLPVENTPPAVTIASAGTMLLFVLWLLFLLWRRLRLLGQSPAGPVLGGFVLAAIALFLAIANGYGADLTLAVRYHFVYFPAVLLLLGALLAGKGSFKGRTIAIVLLVSAVSSGMVVSNQVFQKPHRADLLAAEIRATSQVPVLVAMTNGNELRFRELIALGYEFPRSNATARFLLLNVKPDAGVAIKTLERTIAQLPRPLDIWTVNYTPDAVQGCQVDLEHSSKVNGYKYRRFRCLG